MLAKNVPFLQIIAGIGFFSFANILVCSGLVYYVKYYLGETEAVAGQAASLMQITITAMILPWTIVARYVGKRWAWQAGLAIAFAGLVGLYFSGSRDVSVLYGYIVVYAIGSASIGINFWSIVPDTVEYGEWRTGVRAEAFVFGFVTLIQKIALGVVLRLPRCLPRLGGLCSQSAAVAGDRAGDQVDDYIGGRRRPDRFRAGDALLPARRAGARAAGAGNRRAQARPGIGLTPSRAPSAE